MADEAADAVNYDWWQEFTAQAPGLGSTFTPSIIGFATTLDSVSGLLDARVLITPIAWAVGVYLAAWMFLCGRHSRSLRARSTRRCVRFLRRLGDVLLPLPPARHRRRHRRTGSCSSTCTSGCSQSGTSTPRATCRWSARCSTGGCSMYVIFAGLLALVTTVFDYAKVRAVVEDRRSMMGSSSRRCASSIRHPARVVGLYAANAVIFLLVVAAWATVAPGAGGAGMSMLDRRGRDAVLRAGAADREAIVRGVGDRALPALARAHRLYGGAGRGACGRADRRHDVAYRRFGSGATLTPATFARSSDACTKPDVRTSVRKRLTSASSDAFPFRTTIA